MSIKINPETDKAIDPESIRTLNAQNVIGALIAIIAFVITWKIML